MRIGKFTLAAVLAMMSVVALADDTSAEAKAPPATEPAATAPEAASATPPAIDEAQLTAGYKKIEQDGRTLYCRSEKLTGSRFGKTTCYSLAQLQKRAAQDLEKAQSK